MNDIRDICDMYTSGACLHKIAKKYHCHTDKISQILIDSKVTIRPVGARRKHTLDEQAFSIFSDLSTYWAGFLMADGNVCKSGYSHLIQLWLNKRDRTHIDLFKSFIGASHKIRKCRSMVGVSISSSKIMEDLSKFGVIPNKTFSAKAPTIIEGNKHFWRGMVDGDGWITRSGRDLPTVGLCGSEDIIRQFDGFVKSLSPLCAAKPRRTKSIWCFVTAGKHAIKVLETLYCDCNVSLERKHTLAKEMINLWKKTNKQEQQ